MSQWRSIRIENRRCTGGWLWVAIAAVEIFMFVRLVMRVRVFEDQKECGIDLPVPGEGAYA